MKTKSFDRKEVLLEAAMDEFTVRSYEEASLNNIIKKAGISKGSFYYHFHDKETLYLSLIKNLAEAKIEFMEQNLHDSVYGEEPGVFESLKLQAGLGAEFAKTHPRYYLLSMMFYKEQGSKIYETAINMLGGTADAYFNGILERAAERGEFRDGVSIKFVKRILPYLLYRYDEIFGMKKEEYDFEQAIENVNSLIDFIQLGLGKRSD